MWFGVVQTTVTTTIRLRFYDIERQSNGHRTAVESKSNRIVAVSIAVPGVKRERFRVEFDVAVDSHSWIALCRQVEHSQPVHHWTYVTASLDRLQHQHPTLLTSSTGALVAVW